MRGSRQNHTLTASNGCDENVLRAMAEFAGAELINSFCVLEVPAERVTISRAPESGLRPACKTCPHHGVSGMASHVIALASV